MNKKAVSVLLGGRGNQDLTETKYEAHNMTASALRPSQGFWGFREKGYLFSGIWGEVSFFFKNLGRKHNFLGF